jgi:hypothetical protein
MDEAGQDRLRGRPIKLFLVSEWRWVQTPPLRPFVLFVAARASADDEILIRRFAADAVEAGCRYVCVWGEGCEFVHDLFDAASISADRFVMSTWHPDEELADALYFALTDAYPDPDDLSDLSDSEIVLAVEEPWIGDVRSLVGDQTTLANIVLGDEA